MKKIVIIFLVFLFSSNVNAQIPNSYKHELILLIAKKNINSDAYNIRLNKFFKKLIGFGYSDFQIKQVLVNDTLIGKFYVAKIQYLADVFEKLEPLRYIDYEYTYDDLEFLKSDLTEHFLCLDEIIKTSYLAKRFELDEFDLDYINKTLQISEELVCYISKMKKLLDELYN